MSSSSAKRLCPLCGERMDGRICPSDRVPTVLAEPYGAEGDDPIVGRVLSESYLVEHLLGEGGFGRVYEATQLTMDRRVALKTLRPTLVADRNQLARFYREAKAVSRLTSPHVVRVYDFGMDDDTGCPFLAMELLRGRPLGRVLAEEAPLDPLRLARIAEHVALALSEAEHLGIVHRDLKPDNIFVLDTHAGGEFTKVVDFGIAKMIESEQHGESKLTATGVAIGTPPYMAPEQILGIEVDGRADLYALGCILHEALMGQPPFVGDRASIVTGHLDSPAPQLPQFLPTGVAIPEALRVLHDAMLAKEVDARPASAAAASRILSAVERGEAVDAVAVLEEARTAQGTDPASAGPTRPVVAPKRSVDQVLAHSPTQPREGSSPNATPEDTTFASSPDDRSPTDLEPVSEAGRPSTRPRALVAGLVLLVALVAGFGAWLSSTSNDSTSGPRETRRRATTGARPAGASETSPENAAVTAPAPAKSNDAGARRAPGRRVDARAALSASGAAAPSEEPTTDSGVTSAAREAADQGASGDERDKSVADTAPPTAQPPAKAKPRPRRHSLVSVATSTRPAGAAVHMGTRLVCKSTPCTFDLRTSKRRISLRFSLRGYDARTKAFSVSPGPNELGTVRLVASPVP